MKRKVLITLAVGAAFATPLAAQMSPSTDKASPEQPASAPQPAPDRSMTNPPAAGATASGFVSLDRNKDGYISRDEARSASWVNRFNDIDKDRDGRISPSEYEAVQGSAAGR